MKRKTCKASECDNFIWARGYCRHHDAVANPHKYKIKVKDKKSKGSKARSVAKSKKKKLISLSKLDQLVWEITSLAYRLEDADEMGNVNCATCGKQMYYYGTGMCQMGHFVSRRKKSTKFIRENQLSQCSGCNGPGNGQQYKMGKSIDKRFGIGTADKMLEDSNHVSKFGRDQYKEILINNSILLWKCAKKKKLFEWKDSLAKWKVSLIDKINKAYPIIGELDLGSSRLP